MEISKQLGTKLLVNNMNPLLHSPPSVLSSSPSNPTTEEPITIIPRSRGGWLATIWKNNGHTLISLVVLTFAAHVIVTGRSSLVPPQTVDSSLHGTLVGDISGVVTWLTALERAVCEHRALSRHYQRRTEIDITNTFSHLSERVWALDGRLSARASNISEANRGKSHAARQDIDALTEAAEIVKRDQNWSSELSDDLTQELMARWERHGEELEAQWMASTRGSTPWYVTSMQLSKRETRHKARKETLLHR